MPKNEIILYQPDSTLSIEVRLKDETVWLSLDMLSELFQRDKSTISRHIKNIFSEGELRQKLVVANFATTATDGKTYHVDYYNLDVIISVGYRVKSMRGTQFRIWANSVLKNYILRGYAVNQRIERLEERVSEHDRQIKFFVLPPCLPPKGFSLMDKSSTLMSLLPT